MTTIANFTVEGPVGSGTAGGNPILTGALDGSGNTVANKADASGNMLASVANGVSVATVPSTAPGATDPGLTVRNMPRRSTQVLTTTPLAANGVFTGTWNDSNLDGTVFISVLSFSDQASAASGFVIQESDDTSNANLTRQISSQSASANTLTSTSAALRSRYWRVVYTNGSTLQTNFEMTVTAASAAIGQTNTSGNAQVVQSGTWTVQPGNTPNTTPWLVTQSPSTSGGATLAKVLSAASTNATSVKASAGQVYGYSFANTNAAYRFVHFYDKASAPTVGTDVPAFTVGIPPNFSAQVDFNSGTPFATGIAYAITTGAADSDSAAVGANDVTGFIVYK